MPVIKYCIWDVGNVIYNYTLEPVHDWCERRTADRETFLRNKGKFSYNNYMKGLVPYAELCRQLCDFYDVPYHKDYTIELNQLHSLQCPAGLGRRQQSRGHNSSGKTVLLL